MNPLTIEQKNKIAQYARDDAIGKDDVFRGFMAITARGLVTMLVESIRCAGESTTIDIVQTVVEEVRSVKGK